MIHAFGGKAPDVSLALFVAWNAEVIGDVVLGEETSIWFSATLRGDIERITVGRGTNVQDSASLHTDAGAPLVIGEDVIIGHNAVVHGCTVGDGCLIGMGAIILNRATVGKHCIVAANALVTEGKEFPDGVLILGSPAKAVRAVTPDELARMASNAENYRKRARQMREAGA